MTNQKFRALSLLKRASRFPKPFDPQRVDHLLSDLGERSKSSDPRYADAVKFLKKNRRAGKCLASIAGNSPHLSRVILKDPATFQDVLRKNPETFFSDLLQSCESQAQNTLTIAEIMAVLRRAKTKAALTIAAADILGAWSLSDVTERLSQFADLALNLALKFCLQEAERNGHVALANEAKPEAHFGLALIAMGKYGAHELNYSSDIDFTLFFDTDKVSTQILSGEPSQICISLAKDLVKIIQEMTQDGYVFRTDLRLRPDAGATAIALSTSAAETYYESMGQNWERAAMIKARAAAGDTSVGTKLLDTLSPFIWRKYLDFAAIEDIHAIKRQIHSFRGHHKFAVAGHNIKLGIGGIREIEFFAQTQQLILGGRRPELRDRKTCGALRTLADNTLISQITAKELVESYEFFRLVEHRLQMIEDQQTHTLPDDRNGLANIAYFSNFPTLRKFEKHVQAHLSRVNEHYAALFEQEDPLSTPTGNLVFTGVEDDPETIETLRTLGFMRPEDVSSMIRSWHFGRIRATRSERARELLTKLIPIILQAISKTPEPDTTFIRFADFLEGLPSGVQLFSLFYSNPKLLDLLTETLGLAPRLGPYLAQNASIFDALLDSDFLGKRPEKSELAADLKEALAEANNYEEKLNQARRWCKDEMFRIGLQLLDGRATAGEAANAYTDLADIAVEEMGNLVEREIVNQHGHIRGGEYVILGLGKLGGRELSATSDLDIMVVYDHDGEFADSDGPKPLHAAQYYNRFSQRLIAALSAPTAEGTMYEVDMQLRPSGKAGPTAANFAAFHRYYLSDAWDWEAMALTRARVIGGSPALAERTRQTIKKAIFRTHDPAQLAQNVLEMRIKMQTERGSNNPWELKQVRGGLIDLEFICQFIQLTNAKRHDAIRKANTRKSLEQIKIKRLLNRKTVNSLLGAADLFTALNQYVKLCCEGEFHPETAGESLRKLLFTRIGTKDFDDLEKRLVESQKTVLEIFEQVFVGAARKGRPKGLLKAIGS